MDEFGVKKPSLKVIAKTPLIPKVRNDVGVVSRKKRRVRSTTYNWMGAELSGLKGEEYSAYSVAKTDGGLAVKAVMEAFPAQKAGIKEGDLLLAINKQPTKDRKMLIEVFIKQKKEVLELSIVRNQERIILNLSRW